MNLAHVVAALRSSRVPRWKKLLGLAALAYVVLPLDGVPDVVPLLGWLDDLGVVAAAFTLLAKEGQREGLRQPASQATIEGEVVAR